MPSTLRGDMPPHVELNGHKSDKKRKEDKKEQRKKRKRETDDHADLEGKGHRSHKKSKTETLLVNGNGNLYEATENLETESSRKAKKHKYREQDKEDDVSLMQLGGALQDFLNSIEKAPGKEKKKKWKQETELADRSAPNGGPTEYKLRRDGYKESATCKHAFTTGHTAEFEDTHAVDVDAVMKGAANSKESLQKKSKPMTHKKRALYDEVVQFQPDSTVHKEESPKKLKHHQSKQKHIDEDESLALAVREYEVFSDHKGGAEEEAKKGKTRKDKRWEKHERKRKGAEPPTGGTHMSSDLDVKPSPAATTAPSNPTPAFPFFTQVISLYVPLYPIGFANPHTSVANQHLKPLLNRHSQLLGGVLLDYHNPRLSEHPASSAKLEAQGDRTSALLVSIDEYAPAFGWMTADVDLFVPSRNAPMEGTLNLQSEGHIGVVCWARFNASIEASRLPRGWRWVDLAKRNEEANARAKARVLFKAKGDKIGEDASEEENIEGVEEGEEEEGEEEDALDAEEGPFVQQMHTTGYWVDETGRRVRGNLQFRIKNFDVGLGGDYGYLSIEGTMLGEDDEQELAAREHAAMSKRKSRSSGLLRPETKRIPEFSMTRFGTCREDQEDDGKARTILYKSRPSTPDD